MKRKLTKKYLLGSTLTPAWTADKFEDLPTRKYYWKQWSPEMKVKTDFYTGEALDETWKVLVDDQGNIVDTSNPQVLADYAALSGNGNFKAEHPGVTFTFNKDTKQKSVLPTRETADERIERMSNAPIATQELWELIKQKEDEERIRQTPLGHKAWLMDRDAEARRKTPGAGMLFAAPVALGAGTTMFLANPIAFTGSLIGAEIGGKTLDYPFLQQGYKSFGDWWLGPNASETAKELSNLGTWLGGGMGWSAVKNLDTSLGLNMLKAPTMLADKYAGLWAKEETQRRIVLALLNNYNSTIPQQIEDVIATEISSNPLRSVIKLPNALFAKVGETNKGSVFSLAVNNLKKAIKDTFGNDPVWNLMERAGIPEEQRATVEKVLIKPNLDPNKNWYTDPWNNITYEIKTPLTTDEELIKEFTHGLTSRFKLYKTDPLLKAMIQQEMGWDEETYNNFLKEITKKMMEENSIGVSGKEELSGTLARTTHLKIENPNLPTRYGTLYLINRDRIAGESNNIALELQYAKEAGTHEGYHGITSGINGEADAVGKGIQNEYPLITALMERNKQFLLSVAETLEWYNYFNNTPVYKIVSDLEASGFTPEQIEYVTEFGLPRAKSYNHYILEPQETSARDVVATTLGPGTKNEELLRNIYTPESFNKFHGNLFSKAGDVNEGSAAGSLDIKNFLDRLYKAKKLVEEYLGSEKHVKLIMKSGVSKKEALVIANEMKNNALKVKHRFSSKAGMDSSYGRNPKDNGKISPSIKIGKDASDVETAVYHEYGGHAATLGLLEHDLEKRATTYLGEDDFLGKYWRNILRLSPNLLKINKHNLSLKPIRLPKYLVPDSELSENDKFWLDYFENVDEYSTIARAANIGKGNYHAENDFIDLMKEYFTPESILNLRNLVWSKTGELNKGSTVGASKRPILRKNMHEFSDAEWDAAYEAALEKGNKREMRRLLTLRFQLKAQEYIANGGDDPKILFRGDWRDYLNFRKEGAWLTSDPLYALNYTEDRIAKDRKFFPSKVRKYFVKGKSEQLLPSSIRFDLAKDLKSNYYWGRISDDLMFGVPDNLRRFASMTDSENKLLSFIGKSPKKLTLPEKKAYRLGSADIIVGKDSPVAGLSGYEYWHPSQGLEYYVANPKYVKSANLITYDDAGKMIPLSKRFNFKLNDRRYSWLLPLIPFLYPNKKDQAE